MHGYARILPWTVSAVKRETDRTLHAVFELTALRLAPGAAHTMSATIEALAAP